MKRKIVEEKLRLPYNLQFFAENTKSKKDDDDESDEEEEDEEEEEKLTQEDVENAKADGKKAGKKELLKLLGVKSERELKKIVESAKKGKDDDKPEGGQEPEGENEELNEALERAEAAEAKLACIKAGVSADCVDDVMVIARAKVTDEKTLESVVSEMKKNSRYASFFGKSTDNDNSGDDDKEDDDSTGTGNPPKNNKDQRKGTTNIGEELGKIAAQAQAKKSSFFDD